MGQSGCGKGAERGFSTVELLAAVAILALMSAVAIGATARLREQSSLGALVATVESLMAEASTRAVLVHSHVGVAFGQDEHGLYGRIYEDGDGDGIMREDILSGVDRPVGALVYLKIDEAFAGLPPAVTRDPLGNPIAPGDPARFGRGDILSFGPLGTATPGSLYLQDASGKEAWAFRVTGLTARVRAFRWWKGRWAQVK